jgi:lipopolysaccharide transport system ATP-binding protein
VTDNVVIRAEHVSKEYRLGVINHGTLYRDLQSWWAKRRGRPDPNARIVDTVGQRSPSTWASNDRFCALDDVCFEINQGDVVGVVGRNGAGKSTLLKIISRITAPTRGRLSLKGRVASLLEVGTGFHHELSGRENVYLNGAILGMTRREVTKKFEQIVEFAEVGEFIDTPVKRYSSGMYIRLAFAVAAHLEPEILLVDEVLSVGDINFQRKCIGRMQEIGKDGRTVLFVSHNLAAVNQLCSKGLLLDDGRAAGFGSMASIARQYLDHSKANEKAVFERGQLNDQLPAQILRVAVCDENGRDVSSVELTRDFYLEIQYELSKSLVGLTVNMIVIDNQSQMHIIYLTDPELQPELLGRRPAGRYHASVRIPSRVLNTGKYRVKAILATRFTPYDLVDEVTFEIVDHVGIVHFMGGWDRKNSLLAYQLPWNTRRVGEAADTGLAVREEI